MIHKERARTSSLFLMDLILAILFFSITSAVCVQFFVKSHILSQESKALTLAVNECSAIAETCKTTKDLSDAEELLQEIYPSAEIASHNEDSATGLRPDIVSQNGICGGFTFTSGGHAEQAGGLVHNNDPLVLIYNRKPVR